jgi:hypothetical protein
LSESPAPLKAARLATPGWLDGRLVLGVLLVLTSVVVGARLLDSGSATASVWVVTRDLAAGSTLAVGDLERGQVRLYDRGGSYLLADGAEPTGYVLERGVGAGELLPRQSLVRPDERAGDVRDVSVPIAPGHLPEDLSPGQRVDVYVTPEAPAGGSTSDTRLVLRQVPVTLRPREGSLSASGTSGVVLSVPDADVSALVAAAQAGGIDQVRAPRGDRLAPLPPPPGAATAAGTG